MARTYRRDSRGRFASGGSARSAPKTRVVTGARAVSGGRNRLTRDNAGRITSVGGQGATARGGRLRTASGAKRGAVMVRMKGTGGKLRKPIGGGARVSKAEPLMTGGTLAARSSLTRARRKLAENATPAQRGAVTRAKKYAAQSYGKNTQPRTFGRPGSVMRKRPPEAPLRWQVGGGKGGGTPKAAETRVMVRGNFRPRGVMAKFEKGENPFVSGSTTTIDNASRLTNAKIAKDWVEKRGGKVSVYSGSKRTPARYNETKGTIEINRAAWHWQNPKSFTRAERGARHWSSSSPVGSLFHELGHRKSKGVGPSWTTGSRGGTFEERISKASKIQQLAGRVSRYAQTNPAEFIAETYAGRRTGRRYDSQVMRAYREAMGLPKLRTGSRVKPGGAPVASPRAVSRDRVGRRRR